MKQITFRTDVLPLKDKIYRLALRITANSVDAEDIVQETLIRVWKRRDRWEEIDSIEAWSLTIARNLSLDCVRKNGIRESVPLDFDLPAKDYDRLDESERIRMVRNLMDSLTEKQRTAMHLRDFEGKSYKEIADIMQISEEQVKVNIFRARQFVKQKYSKIYEL